MENRMRWKSRKSKIHRTMTESYWLPSILCGEMWWLEYREACLLCQPVSHWNFFSLSRFNSPPFFPVADYHSDTVRHNMHSERRMRRGSAEERMKLSVDANRSTGNLFTATRSQISSIDTGYWLRSHTGQFFDWEKNEWHWDTRPSWE